MINSITCLQDYILAQQLMISNAACGRLNKSHEGCKNLANLIQTKMATIDYEICSFLSKFRQLCDFGLNTNLSFNNSSGNISVSLQVDIGNIRQHSKKKGASHSRSRRRKRRNDASTEDMTYEPASAVNESQTTYESDQPISNSESENDL